MYIYFSIKKPKDLSWIKNSPIAHRGLHDIEKNIPENSLSAFQKAVEQNYPIELDIHLLADEKIVVFHDYDLMRLCGVNKKINQIYSSELSNYQLINTDDSIPLFQEVLRLVDGKVPLLIELKEQIVSHRNKKFQHILMKELRGYKGQIAVQSFDPFLLNVFAKERPKVPRGQLSSNYREEKMNFLKKSARKNYLLNAVSKPYFIGHDVLDISLKRVQQLRNQGRTALAWTVTSQEQADTMHEYFDNIIFENFIPNKSRK